MVLFSSQQIILIYLYIYVSDTADFGTIINEACIWV